MPDARYYRSQAEICLAVARLTTAPILAEDLRQMAARYLSRAESLESEIGDEPRAPS